MTAGYSGTPLVRKLGIDEDDRLVLLDEPASGRSWRDGSPRPVAIDEVWSGLRVVWRRVHR